MANIDIGGRLHSTATGNVVAGANEILDDSKGKKQSAINAEVDTALEGKQDEIADLSTIRSGAAAGATAYQKPGTGIPATDMASGVQTSLGKADSAYQKPSGGIPKTDLESGVQESLELADSAVQADPIGSIVPPVDPSEFATKEEVEGLEAKVDKNDSSLNGTSLDFVNGKYYKSSDNTIATSASYCYCKVENCKVGDRLRITARNGGSATALLYTEVPDDGTGNVDSAVTTMNGGVYTITKDCTFYVNAVLADPHSVVFLPNAIIENECVNSILSDAFAYSNIQYSNGKLSSATIKWPDGTNGSMSVAYNADNTINYIRYIYGSTIYKYKLNYTGGRFTSSEVTII